MRIPEEDEDDEKILERLEDAHDAVEEIVRLSGERDKTDYLRDLRIRVRKSGGEFYLNLAWYRRNPPASSIIYSPKGWIMTKWYRTIDKDGTQIWETGLERQAK